MNVNMNFKTITLKSWEITFIYSFSIFQIRVFDEHDLILFGRAKYDRYKNHI